jgi:phospholipid transport system substrate-binding protein
MAQPTPAAAEALVSEVGAEVLTILKDPAAGHQAKFDRLVGILEGPIDLDLVAKLILGRHWRSVSKEQQAQYLELFRAYALEFLASKLHLYSGQEFQVIGAKAVGERDAVVATRILSDGGPPLKVDWRLREREDGSLVTIDVVVEGVSLIVSQRSEFASVIERQGFDGLLTELRQRSRRPA